MEREKSHRLGPLTQVLSAVAVAVTMSAVSAGEPTRASQSVYEGDISQARTSENLTLADLAWHAKNTYGWPCEEVDSRGTATAEGYFVITCKGGARLRVYPRPNQHPRITNLRGTYK